MSFTSLKMMVLTTALCLCCLTAAAGDDQDLTVTIPASGHLAFKSERNFTGPSAITVSNFYGSANATSKGLIFQNQQLGEDVVIACYANSSTGLILTAQPGTYTLTLTDRAPTRQFFTTSVSWAEEPGTVDESSRQRAVYKFVNETGRVGFGRDETYADRKYMLCDLAEGEHVYLAVGEKNLERISATMQTTTAELSFIPWSQELWGCPEPSDAAGVQEAVNGNSVHRQYTDLLGRHVLQPSKGIYISNGKKLIIR